MTDTGPETTAEAPLTAEDVIDRLGRAIDKIKPEPGMDGPPGGHRGPVTLQYAVKAMEDAMLLLATLDRAARGGEGLLREALDWLIRSAEGSCSNPRCPSEHEGDAPDCLDYHIEQARFALTVSAAIEPVDVLAGGFPCQPASVAGRRLGTGDSRWLWPEFARAIRDVRPRLAIVENVAGLLNPWTDRATGERQPAPIGEVAGDLAAIGYDVEWTSFPASALGAPHYRDRVFLIAFPHAARSSAGRRGRGARRAGPPRADSSSAGLAARATVPDAIGDDLRLVGERDGEQRPEPRTAEPRDDGPDGRMGSGRGGDSARRPMADPQGEPVGPGLREDRSTSIGRGRPRDGGSPDGRPGWLEPLADAARLGMEGDGSSWLVIPPAPVLAALLGRYGAGPGAGQWSVEPDVGRMAHGVARRGDRLWTLGNGVVPQVGEVIGWLARSYLEDQGTS